MAEENDERLEVSPHEISLAAGSRQPRMQLLVVATMAICMNKRTLIKKIIAKLTGELEVYFRAAQFSRAEATHESNKAENKYDTRGLEASYLARGQSKQAAELEEAIAEFEKLKVRDFALGDKIEIGAVVELEITGERFFYFIGPRAGGTEIVQDKKEILVITPQSPLGQQLVGKKSGEKSEFIFGSARQISRIINVE
jgi:transcription elongation GreA/GreB family factor